MARSGSNLGEFSGDPYRPVCLAIFDNQNHIFTPVEVSQINDFVERGNSLLVCGDGAESRSKNTNINQLLRRYGVMFNQDCVLRPNCYKLYHPKEAQLEDFIVNRGLDDVMRKFISKSAPSEDTLFKNHDGPRMIYSRGCTLTVNNKISTIMMTSSKWALPSSHAICAFHRAHDSNQRVVAIGSSEFINDTFINVENNRSVLSALLEFMVDKDFPINISDAKTVEIPENNITPDINRLIDMPIPYLRESDPLPEDKSELLNRKLFSLDSSMLVNLSRAFKELDVPYTRLTLIKPEIKLNPYSLKPATHNFVLMYPKDKKHGDE